MPHSEEELAFMAPAEVHSFDGLLFDMDGTIIDSTAAIVKHWHAIAKEIGVDPEVILATSHGRRSIDVLREYDPTKANNDYVTRIEAEVPRKYGADAVEIPGSRALLAELEKAGAKWAIVTSGTRGLISGWLDIMELAHPRYLIAAEDVKNGKPDPEGYLLGYRSLGLASGKGEHGARSAVVFEDAPAGVRAGKAAGFKVVALATTHKVEQLREAGADWIVRDMRSVTLKSLDVKSGKATIEITNALIS